jgi:(p)ppGpp synthase/HD superfamily hydrolase
VIAALLHDSIEDQEVPHSVIVQGFGTGVAELVEAVTDDKKLEKQERDGGCKSSMPIRNRSEQRSSNWPTRQAI